LQPRCVCVKIRVAEVAPLPRPRCLRPRDARAVQHGSGGCQVMGGAVARARLAGGVGDPPPVQPDPAGGAGGLGASPRVPPPRRADALVRSLGGVARRGAVCPTAVGAARRAVCAVCAVCCAVCAVCCAVCAVCAAEHRLSAVDGLGPRDPHLLRAGEAHALGCVGRRGPRRGTPRGAGDALAPPPLGLVRAPRAGGARGIGGPGEARGA